MRTPVGSAKGDNPGDGNVPAPSEFELEFYKLHRAHEVALNNATAGYEQTALRLLLVLNAAAIPVFLGLIQSIGKEPTIIHYHHSLARQAIYIWSLGILLAFVATVLGYASQRAFTRAYRYRRQAEEARYAMVQRKPEILGWFGIRNDENKSLGEVHKGLLDEANKYRDSAGYLQKWVYGIGAGAVVVAVFGFATAIWSIR
jgi:hypothetical protein